jgi:hypothetical protein
MRVQLFQRKLLCFHGSLSDSRRNQPFPSSLFVYINRYLVGQISPTPSLLICLVQTLLTPYRESQVFFSSIFCIIVKRFLWKWKEKECGGTKKKYTVLFKRTMTPLQQDVVTSPQQHPADIREHTRMYYMT